MKISSIKPFNFKGINPQKQNEIKNQLREEIEHQKEVKKEYYRLQHKLGFHKPMLITVEEKCKALQMHYAYYITEIKKQDPMLSESTQEMLEILGMAIGRFEILKGLDETMYSRKLSHLVFNELGMKNTLIKDKELMKENIKLLNEADARIVKKLQGIDLVYLLSSKNLKQGLDDFSKLSDKEIEKLSHGKFMDTLTNSTEFSDKEKEIQLKELRDFYLANGYYPS